jgi:hypothetical protein
MLKKALVVAVLAGSSIFLMSTAAQAITNPYPDSNPIAVVVDGSGAVTPVGEPQALPFTGFAANEPTTATADAAVTLGALKTVVSLGKTANGDGAVTYSASATVPGTYTITVTGFSGSVATATLVVVPLDAAGALPNTGFNSPLLAIWVSGGALVFGIAMVIVRLTVRRKRATV